ncbi:MAG: hypothetical protein O7G85_13230 [Planctomycetota bacterium]|nr:hypothetical protein [Planctomycetota bacterium]
MKLSLVFRFLLVGPLLGFVALLVIVSRGMFWIGNLEGIIKILTVLLVLGFGGMACTMAMDRNKYRHLMMSGLIAGALAALGWIVFIVMIGEVDWSRHRVLWTLLSPTGWFMMMVYLAGLSGVKIDRPLMKWLCVLSIVCTGLFCIVGIYSVGRYYQIMSESSGFQILQGYSDRAITNCGVLGLFTFFSLMLVAVLAAMPRLEHKEVPTAQRLKVHLTCPRCKLEQSILSDGDACSACRLRIKVTPT